jgi:hypothetical protein
MTIVIADTSPINYLILIGEIEILSRLYNQVVIPEEVAVELVDHDAPAAVRVWMEQRPRWIEIRKSPIAEPSLMELDAGEAAAKDQPNLRRRADRKSSKCVHDGEPGFFRPNKTAFFALTASSGQSLPVQSA